MNIKIIYFSGTGNTKLITEKISGYLTVPERSIDLIKAEDYIRDSKIEISLRQVSLLGLGFPVYDLLAPDIINEVIDKMPERNDPTPVFLFSTQAFIKGDCLNLISRKLKKKGYYVIKKRGFNCPSNGLCFYEDPNHSRYKHVRFEKNIEQNIEEFSDAVCSEFERFKLRNFHKGGLVFRIYNIIRKISRVIYGEKYYKDLEVNGDCNFCRLCEKKCPQSNLICQSGKIIIKKTNGCLRCLRCVAVCPSGAVSFSSSRKIGIYSKHVMMNLYDEANK